MADGSQDAATPGAESSKILKSAGFAALDRAEQGVVAARQQAEGIIATAHVEAATLREAAEREGREAAAALVGEYLARMQRDIAHRQERLVALVGVCLRRVMEPIPAEELIAAAVARTFVDSHPGTSARLTVAPRLVQTLQAHFSARGISADVLEVRGDPDCPLGASTLHCDFGDIELDIEAQIVALEEGMQLAVRQGAS